MQNLHLASTLVVLLQGGSYRRILKDPRPITSRSAYHLRYGAFCDAMLPASAAAQVRYTNPSIRSTIVAFFIGNLFANFLILVAACVVILRFFQVPVAWTAAVVAAYYAHVFTAKAHVTGWASGKRGVLSIFSGWTDYFDPRVIIDGELKEGKRYIIGCSPHGIHGFGTGVLMEPGSEFFKRFPFMEGKLVGLAAKVLFFVPLVREIFLSTGWRDASRWVAERAMREGNSLYILVGGEAEALLSAPGRDDAIVAGKRRRGFVRLALESGAELVPMYAFHNTSTYCTASLLSGFRNWLSRRFQVCLPIFWGRWFLPLPFNVQLTVAFGAPLPLPEAYRPEGSGPVAGSSAGAAAGGKADATGSKVDADASASASAGGAAGGKAARRTASDADIDDYQAAYVSALQALFEKHKAGAGYATDRKLNIVVAD